MRRRPLPLHLRGTSFRFSEIGGVGLTPRRLRAPDIQHPFRGARSIDVDLATVLGRCRSFEPLLAEGAAFSHTTALAMWGAPVPASPTLHVSVLFPRTPPRRPGVLGHSLQRLEVALLHGLPAMSPASAWRRSAVLLDPAALVAAGDALVTGRRVRGIRGAGRSTLEELHRACELEAGSPGARRARSALRRIRVGVDSPGETRLRLLLAWEGLPEPEVDHAIRLDSGLVLHADLAYPAARLAIEYEGDGHRTDARVWQRDVERRELMEDAGWRVVRVTAAVRSDPRATIERIARFVSAGRVSGSDATEAHESRVGRRGGAAGRPRD